MRQANVKINIRERDWRWLWLRKRDRWVSIFRGYIDEWTAEDDGATE